MPVSVSGARASVQIRGASLAFGSRVLWSGLDLDVEPGEFLAVLGPNGSGKTSLLKVLLGLQRVSAGSVQIVGEPPSGGNPKIGYIPQQRAMGEALTLRGSDLVGLGLDWHRWERACGASASGGERWQRLSGLSAPSPTASRRSGVFPVVSSSGSESRRR
jgi:zinc/manganese transport system ATP-binding protein